MKFLKKIPLSIAAIFMSFAFATTPATANASEKKYSGLNVYGGVKTLFLNEKDKYVNQELFYRGIGGIFGIGVNNYLGYDNGFKISENASVEGSRTETSDEKDIHKSYGILSVFTTNFDFSLKNKLGSNLYIGPYLGYQFQKANYKKEYNYKEKKSKDTQETADNNIFLGAGLDIGKFGLISYYKKNINDNTYSGFGYGIKINNLFDSDISLALKREHDVLHHEREKLYYERTSYNLDLIFGLENDYSFILGGGKTNYNHEKIPPAHHIEMFVKKKF